MYHYKKKKPLSDNLVIGLFLKEHLVNWTL